MSWYEDHMWRVDKLHVYDMDDLIWLFPNEGQYMPRNALFSDASIRIPRKACDIVDDCNSIEFQLCLLVKTFGGKVWKTSSHSYFYYNVEVSEVRPYLWLNLSGNITVIDAHRFVQEMNSSLLEYMKWCAARHYSYERTLILPVPNPYSVSPRYSDLRPLSAFFEIG